MKKRLLLVSLIAAFPSCLWAVHNTLVDPNEQFTFTEDAIIAGAQLANFKLVGAVDPDGDDIDVVSLDAWGVSATIDGNDVRGDFSLSVFGFVAMLTHAGSGDVATFIVDPETGTEDFASLNDTFWDSLNDGDVIRIMIDYTVSDGTDTDQSTQTITINGVTDEPSDMIFVDGFES